MTKQTLPTISGHVTQFPALLFVLLAAALPAKGEALGRLFFTPAERAALDRQRLLGAQEVQAEQAATLSINGIVRSSGGTTTVWINGIPQDGNSLRTGKSGNPANGWNKKGLGNGLILINPGR